MAMAKMTLIGMESYVRSLNPDDSLFKAFDVFIPANTIDKAVFIQQIIVRGGELPLVYNDPLTVKKMVRTWAMVHKDTIQRMYDAVAAEYNPIHNYDRTEAETTSGARSSTEDTRGSDAGSTTRTRSGEDSGSSTGSTRTDGSTVNEQENTAYDADTYKAVQRDTSTVGDSQSTVSSSANRQSETEEGADSRSRTETRKAEESHGDARTLHAYGNIGVTTNAQMVEQEMLLRKTFNIYETLAEMFIADFCVLVW